MDTKKNPAGMILRSSNQRDLKL